jgi:hypothetical protein
MNALISRNASGELRSGPAGRGFYDGVRRCRGVTKLLKRFVRGNTAEPTARVERRGWRTMASSRRCGAGVHRVLMHDIVCAVVGCTCGTAAPDRRLAALAFSRACLAGARAFLAAAGLRPAAGELVVAHPWLPVATRVDLVCRDARGRAVVVSWKSGGGAANAVELRRHKTQVAFEWSLLEGAGERVAAAYVVYVGGALRGAELAPFYFAHPVARDEARALADALAARIVQL